MGIANAYIQRELTRHAPRVLNVGPEIPHDIKRYDWIVEGIDLEGDAVSEDQLVIASNATIDRLAVRMGPKVVESGLDLVIPHHQMGPVPTKTAASVFPVLEGAYPGR